MDDANKIVSRRQAVGLVGMGLATAAANTAIAQQSGASGSGSAQPAKDDPRSKYPRPPFPQQTQPWPGLAGKMNPRPDHGEKSYKGSGRLNGRDRSTDFRRRAALYNRLDGQFMRSIRNATKFSGAG
jgi:hypothetical protein